MDKLKKAMLAAPVIKKEDLRSKSGEGRSNAEEVPKVELKSVSRQLFDVISVLKERLDDVPISEVEALGINVLDNPELLGAIRANHRIAFNETAQTLGYRQTHHIRSTDDLLRLVNANAGIGCLDYKELKESYVHVKDLIDQLYNQSLLLVIRNQKDSSPRAIYQNDPDLNLSISDEFKTMWHSIIIPSKLDMPTELEKAGLKPMATIGEGERKVQTMANKRGGGTRKRRGRFKLTNTHLEGVDLTKDVSSID